MSGVEQLQTLVTAIEEMSADSSMYGKLLQHLQAQEQVLIQNLPQLDELLPVLDPRHHTLGMVFILNCKAAAVPLSNLQTVNTYLRQCRRLLLGCDPQQLQMVPAQVVAVCHKFSAAACVIKTPTAAIRPLMNAALSLQPSPAHFTPIHAECMRMCLLSKCYSAAQPLLDQELLQVDKEATHLAPRDLLLFHYYAGMIQIGLKRFKSAIQYLTLCFSAPTQVLNVIMIEAYKKCMLCSLIEHGDAARSPKYTALVLQRHVKDGISPYVEFAEAFNSKKLSELRASLAKHIETFERDHNLGLAKQCLQALIRRTIHRLTQTYLTLSLEHIAVGAELSGADEAERYITSMVSRGEISAAIDEAKGMVHFTERDERYDSSAALAMMEGNIRRGVELASKLVDMNSQLAADQNYLSHLSHRDRPAETVGL